MYHGRRFIPLHGMLMEVPEDAYKAFYKRKRREKYLKDRSKDNGEDILVDTVADTQGQAARNLLLDKLRRALNKLSEEERTLLEQYYFTGVSECELSVIYMESCKQKSSPKIGEIKNFLENEKVYTKSSLQAEIFCRPRK